MSYHRQEVEEFLEKNGVIETKADIERVGEAEISFLYRDPINPSDDITCSGSATIEFNEKGEVETSTLDIINQDPDFFIEVLQAKYDRDSEGEQVDFESGYDSGFMEALAGIINEQAEQEIKNVIEYSNRISQPDVTPDDVLLDTAGKIEVEKIDENIAMLYQDVSINGEEICIAFKASVENNKITGLTGNDEYENDMNDDIRDRVRDIFQTGDYNYETVRENTNEVMSRLAHMVKNEAETELKREAKKEKKRSIGLSM